MNAVSPKRKEEVIPPTVRTGGRRTIRDVDTSANRLNFRGKPIFTAASPRPRRVPARIMESPCPRLKEPKPASDRDLTARYEMAKEAKLAVA